LISLRRSEAISGGVFSGHRCQFNPRKTRKTPMSLSSSSSNFHPVFDYENEGDDEDLVATLPR